METAGMIPAWATIVISLIGGGGLTTIILALLGKIKTSHDKGLDISKILCDMEDKLIQSNGQFKAYCDETIERLKDDNAEIRNDKNEMKEVIAAANDCVALRDNPSFRCVVLDADRERYRRKVSCDNCRHKEDCDKKEEQNNG